MTDGPAKPQDDRETSIGDTLDHLLEALRRQGLAIGIREQVAAHALVTELIALGRAQAIGDLRHSLRPLLARTEHEREAYDSVFSSWAPAPPDKPAPPPPPPPPPPPRWQIAALAVLAIAIALAVILYASNEGKQTTTTVTGAGTLRPPPPPPITEDPTPPAAEPERTPANTALQRIAVAAAAHGGAPTLQELAQSLPVSPPDAITEQSSQDGKLRVSLSADRRGVFVFSDDSTRPVELRGDGEKTITSLAFSPDGRILATGSTDKTISLWKQAADSSPRTLTSGTSIVFALPDLADYKGLKSFKKHRILQDGKTTTGLSFSADGRYVLAGADDGTVREWDAATGELRETNLRNGYPAGYARKFHEWTGLPLSVPIAIYGTDGRDPTTWARLAMALQRLERPGREPATLAELRAEAANILGYREEKNIPVVYRLQALTAKLPTDQQGRTRKDLLQTLERSKDLPADATSAAIERALAITPGLKLSPEFYSESSWQPRRPASNARFAPTWAPFIAFMFPVAFALFWLANSLALRKAWLRRRPPHVPPLRLDIVAEVSRRLASSRGTLRRIAQRLQARTPESTDWIDVEGTIARTVASGTGFISPAYAQALRTPEYLVLIERRAVGDQQTEHLKSLARRIGELVPMSVYTFQSDPAWLEPQGAPDRPQPLEQVAASHAGSRLVILGSGHGLLDPFTLQLRTSASQLLQFRHRALLTPVPVAEWGRSEFTMARQLAMPVARATPDGLARLPELLGLEGPRDGHVVDMGGDGLARALPAMLRTHPDRFLYDASPDESEVPQLVRALRNFLDPAGFDWLCALAVYPAVQWDLTLYLGVALSARMGAEPSTEPMYREDRVAALTHLPWLQEGSMPPWLRRALIRELDRSGRTPEVRDTIRKLIEAAQPQAGHRNEDDVLLRIAREEGHEPERFFEDEVLLDFLARGRVEDFALSRGTWLERVLPRGLLERLGIPGLAAGGISLVYAAAAWWVTPKASGTPGGLWSETPAALVSGAWVPLFVLAAGAVLSLGFVSPETTGHTVRTVTRRIASPFLALAMLLGLAEAAAQWLPSIPSLIWPPATLVAAFLSLRLARRIAQWQWMERAPSMHRRWRSRAIDTAIAVVLAGLAWLDAKFLASLPTGTDVGVALVPFALAWWFARHPPRIQDIASRARQGMAMRMDATARMLAAVLLAVPALLAADHIAATSRALGTTHPGSAALATTQDRHFLAVGGIDGRVNIFDLRDPAKPPQSIATPLGPITGIAIAQPEKSRAPVIAAIDTKGLVYVRHSDGTNAPSGASWADAMKLTAAGQATQLALSPEGRLLVATEDETASARIVAGQGATDSTMIEGRGSITALSALDQDRFAVATMDGSVWVVSLGHAGDNSVPAKPTLTFPASRVRHLSYNGTTRRLTVSGDDGTILSARFLANETLQPEQASIPAALDKTWLPAVKWNASAEELPPASGTFRDCDACPQMVVVPAGSFVMGSPAGEEGRADDEGPLHTVTIAQAFAVGKFEVTFAEWDACVTSGGCNGRSPADEGWGRGNRPVINVSWLDAQSYVQWLSRLTGKRYRLLSEAEWEYAARAGTTTAYPWGASASHEFANYGKDECCDGLAQGRDRWENTAPVGSFPSNSLGLHDMHGNAWEWTEDCWNDSYAGAPTDGSAWRAGDCTGRVMRGGSWDVSPQVLRSAGRSRDVPSGRSYDGVGFRVARIL